MDEGAKPVTTLPYQEKDLVYSLTGIPLKVPGAKKTSKAKYCTVNALIRVHYRTFHSVRVRMYKLIRKLIQANPVQSLPDNKYTAVFVYYAPDKRRRDLSNMCAFIDKFLMDSLVHEEVIPEDDVSIIIGTHYIFGGVTPNNNTISFYLFKEEDSP